MFKEIQGAPGKLVLDKQEKVCYNSHRKRGNNYESLCVVYFV